jgi:hypothetical protein
MKTRNETRKLTFEQCEKREVMAGNVQAGIWGGELVIQGDNNSNQVEVSEYMNGFYEVKGSNGTTINGGTAAYLYNPTDKVNAYLYGGDDLLVFGNKPNRQTAMAGVYVDMGSGADQLGFWGTSVGFNNSTVVMGADWENDADTFDMGKNVFAGPNSPQATFWGNLNVRTGGGNDQVIFRDSSYIYSNLSINTGNGNDQVRVDRLNVRDFFADLGSGDDQINVGGLTARGNINIDAGIGYDIYLGSLDNIWLRRARNFEYIWR